MSKSYPKRGISTMRYSNPTYNPPTLSKNDLLQNYISVLTNLISISHQRALRYAPYYLCYDLNYKNLVKLSVLKDKTYPHPFYK
jgi:hypothetical protein